MKKNKVMASGLIALLAVSTLSGLTVSAAEANSKGSVEFVTDSDTTPKPFDPSDPNRPPQEVEPTDPTKPDGPGNGTNGLLRFDRVPNFKFEKITIGSKPQIGNVYEEEYTVKGTTTKFHAAPSVEITDVRGTAAGWKASVKTDGVLKASNDITGFQLKLNKAVISSYSSDTTTAPTLNISDTNSIELSTTDSEFVTAPSGTGTATWGISFYDSTDATASEAGKPKKNTTGKATTSDAVTLTIPQGAVMKTGETYTTDLTWTLTDA